MANQTAAAPAAMPLNQAGQAIGQAQGNGRIASLGALSNKVWLIVPDYGSDGLREPVAAYRTKLDADRAMQLLTHGHQSFRCVELPIW